VKAVLDTNVVIAAFLTDGLCSKLLVRARRNDFELLLSREITQEFEKNLRKKFKLTAAEVNQALTVLLEAGETVQEVRPIPPICRNPEDDKILALAKQEEADYLVTGDQDLLIIEQYDQTRIVTPKSFEGMFED
jgi:putative PIN family toxin of toxin-antitoxin system